jgi:hypothetical protein
MKKRILKYAAALFTGLLLMTASCEKWIDPDINLDPDAVLDAPMNMLLSSAETNIGFIVGGFDVVGTTGMWSQYVTGAARQAKTIGSYTITEADVDNLWGSMYDGILMDLKLMIDKSVEPEKESPHFEGVGQVLTALSLGVATDLWNNIPYSQSFQGLDNLKPTFDTQQQIYTKIDALLADASANLSTDEGDNFLTLSNDMIYADDNALWKKAANSLRARYATRLSQRTTVNWANVLTYCAAGFTSNDDNMIFNFGESDSYANPLYQFHQQRTDCSPSTFWEGRIAGDPREPILTEGEVYNFDDLSPFGSFIGDISSGVALMTFPELKFIEAEAHLRKAAPDQAAADIAYQEAVMASLDYYGVAGTNLAWEAANITGVSNVTLNMIYQAKYTHLFMQLEGYNEWRRTGVPTLTPVSGTQVPVRFPYPTSERLYNTANVPTGITIFTPVWWDN